MVGRMVGRWTAEKKRRKNFVLGSPFSLVVQEKFLRVVKRVMLWLTKSPSPYFSLFLLTLTLCVCPVPEKSDNMFIKQAKCIDGSKCN